MKKANAYEDYLFEQGLEPVKRANAREAFQGLEPVKKANAYEARRP